MNIFLHTSFVFHVNVSSPCTEKSFEKNVLISISSWPEEKCSSYRSTFQRRASRITWQVFQFPATKEPRLPYVPSAHLQKRKIDHASPLFEIPRQTWEKFAAAYFNRKSFLLARGTWQEKRPRFITLSPSSQAGKFERVKEELDICEIFHRAL